MTASSVGLGLMMTGLAVASASATALPFSDGDMFLEGSGGIWTKAGAVIYGFNTNSFTLTEAGNGGGNPGTFLYAGISKSSVGVGGQDAVYAGPVLAIDSVEDLGTFDYAFDLRVVANSNPAPTFSVKPVIFHNVNSSLVPLIYTGDARVIDPTQTDWETETWENLSVDDFAQLDSFYNLQVATAADRFGIFRVGFFASVRTGGTGFLNWGVDNVTLTESSIPEPSSSVTLAALAGLGFAALRRRQIRVS